MTLRHIGLDGIRLQRGWTTEPRRSTTAGVTDGCPAAADAT
ncbi:MULTISPECIES: hypothetical protein [unclassified Micromonospora]|nr:MULTISPECIES: hypothetical protein [unclassified Micromonospora]MDM4778595.1 hypothetical protein [Micromonospora sp. b486]